MIIEEKKRLKELFETLIDEGHGICFTIEKLKSYITYPAKEGKLYQNKVEEEFVGTHAEYLKALAIAEAKDKREYNDKLNEYRELNCFIEKLFYNKLAEDNGYNADSKEWGIIVSKAYENGHSEGYRSIYYEVSEICELLSEIEKAKESK
jgi:hypothetical protein